MCLSFSLSLSLSLIKYISIFSVAVLFLVSWLPNLHKFSVFFVRWFWSTLFRASSSRTRGARDTERKRCLRQSLRGTFASSTKYLRQSSRPYLAALSTQSTLYLIRYLSFFDEIFQDVQVTTACCLHCRFFFRLSRRFHFVEKKSKTVEVSSMQQLVHTTLFHHTGNH